MLLGFAKLPVRAADAGWRICGLMVVGPVLGEASDQRVRRKEGSMYQKTIRFALLLALCACGASCSNNSQSAPEASDGVDRQVLVTRTNDGATLTEIYTTSAVVSAVDEATRSVTLSTADGHTTTFKAGHDVRNFDQIAVGDNVTARVWEQFSVYLQKGNPTTQAEAAVAAARVPKGAKPGGFIVASTEQTATIVALDLDTRQLTLQFADGRWQSFQVGENINLAKATVGDKISARHTEGAAILVQGK
jgi:hypothetical protein